MKTFLTAALFVTCASSAFAASSDFQQTCSNIEFSYLGRDAGIAAVCLSNDGTPTATSIVINGIGNDNGIMTLEGSGPSTFQQSCGDIEIQASAPDYILVTALCRNNAGGSNPTTIEVLGITNNNGNLTY